MLRRLSIVAALACCAVVCSAGAGHASDLAVDAEVSSVALSGPMHALVVLPAGYWTSNRRYPVVYFLHGLPAGASAYRSNGWLAQRAAAAGSFILVEAQGARDGDSDAEYLDWGDGRNWGTYLTRELPHYVDTHFRTISSRSARAIVGLSAGGYGAAMLGLNHLDEFGAIESWSGYFHATDPTGKYSIAAPSSANVHALVVALARDAKRRQTFIGFYVGKSDPIFVTENEEFDRELTAAGVPHTFAEYIGAHETKLWTAHASAWLRLALTHLSAA